MRFTRYPRAVERPVTPRRLAYARRAVEKDRERVPLFPELMRYPTAEVKIASQNADALDRLRHLRQYFADSWRRARRALRALPDPVRGEVVRRWQSGYLPGSPSYLLGLIENEQIKIAWATHPTDHNAAALAMNMSLSGFECRASMLGLTLEAP